MEKPRLLHPTLSTALAAFLLLGCATAHATQWKWRDADGRIQYSDRPPPTQVADKDILTRPSAVVRPSLGKTVATDAASAAAKPMLKASDPELEAKKRKAEAEQEAQKKAEEDKMAKSKADNCQRARNYLRDLDSGSRIARMNDKGEREVLDDKARANERTRAQQSVEANCK
jgi:Domain of unknown function (DUF4124)